MDFADAFTSRPLVAKPSSPPSMLRCDVPPNGSGSSEWLRSDQSKPRYAHFLNLPAAQASRADNHPLDAAADGRANLFQIRMPSTLGLVVRMADVVADRLMLFANRAVLHDALLFRFEIRAEMNVLG